MAEEISVPARPGRDESNKSDSSRRSTPPPWAGMCIAEKRHSTRMSPTSRRCLAYPPAHFRAKWAHLSHECRSACSTSPFLLLTSTRFLVVCRARIKYHKGGIIIFATLVPRHEFPGLDGSVGGVLFFVGGTSEAIARPQRNFP